MKRAVEKETFNTEVREFASTSPSPEIQSLVEYMNIELIIGRALKETPKCLARHKERMEVLLDVADLLKIEYDYKNEESPLDCEDVFEDELFPG